MKYASEVIALMGAHPGRQFRMAQIVRHVTKGLEVSPTSRQAVRVGVRRVLESLIENGQVVQVKESETSSVYFWQVKLIHAVDANCYAN
ncbi:phage protein [Alcaligenes faecalis subsp. faecalis NCIB 8687]|nr:phage protein [Alcaligenes faecalis subsp. faecalis NCIB 8687]